MTVKQLIARLSVLPSQDAEVLVQVHDPNDPEAPDDYTVEDVTFMDLPTHYRSTGTCLELLSSRGLRLTSKFNSEAHDPNLSSALTNPSTFQ